MKELKMENQWICTLQHALTRQNYKGKNGKEDFIKQPTMQHLQKLKK